MKKKLLIGLALVIILTGVYFAVQGVKRSQEFAKIRGMQIENVDLAQLPDQRYLGEFGYGATVYKVAVVVENHQIKDVEILHNRDSKYAKMAERVRENVLEAQALDVDVISGATTTSKALLKAMENALKSKSM